jgi:prefoldin subunit 5
MLFRILTTALFAGLGGLALGASAQDAAKPPQDAPSAPATLEGKQAQLQSLTQSAEALQKQSDSLTARINQWKAAQTQLNSLPPAGLDKEIEAFRTLAKGKTNVLGDRAVASEVGRIRDKFFAPFTEAVPDLDFPGFGGPDDDLREARKVLTAIRDKSEYRQLTLFFPESAFGVVSTGGTPVSGKEVADKLQALFSDSQFNNAKADLSKALQSAIDADTKRQNDLKQQIATTRAQIAKLNEDIAQDRSDIQTSAIRYGLPLFCITVVVLFLVSHYMSLRLQQQQPDNQLASSVLDLTTVLLLTMTILILGLADKIKGEVLGTLLGGISGYVLNRIGSVRNPRGVSGDQGNGAAK